MNDRNRCNADMGDKAAAVNLERLAACNQNYRTALWTGEYQQVTLMCIPVGGDIGAEMHCDTDQLLVVVSGCALACTGPCRNRMNDRRRVTEGCAALIPAGTWHNLVNIGQTPLKLYSVYAPPHHPAGTVQQTKRDALCAAD